MDRLKQEWRETEIPEQIARDARDRAWNRITKKESRPLRWSLVAAAGLAVLILIWNFNRKSPVSVKPQLTAAKSTPAAKLAIVPKTSSAQAPLPFPSMVVKHRVTRKHKPAGEKYDRIVLHFQLPQSGAKMIWTMDSRFHLE